MPRKKPPYPSPRGRPSLVDCLILKIATDPKARPVSWSNFPKEWNVRTLQLDEPTITIRRRAFYRAIDKLTKLCLLPRSNPGSYPAEWKVPLDPSSRYVTGMGSERQAAMHYLTKREREIDPPYSTGKNETRTQKYENVKIMVKAVKISRHDAKKRGIKYKPKPMWLDESKRIVQEDEQVKRLSRRNKRERHILESIIAV